MTGIRQDRILTVTGATKRFGAVTALSNVDFWVDEGEVVALVGDNGAGKSTLVKMLAGVHAPDSGTLEYDGRRVSLSDPADAHDLGIATVFQDLALCENLDVVANVWLGRELVTDGRLDEVEMEQRTWSLLRDLSARIPSVRDHVSTLSGGQRQTVAIARSLVGEPKIVILDEPTAALGVAQTAEVLNLIERLRERGHGVVLVSHNMADVMAVADRVAVLRLGRNNGVYNVAEITTETLLAAITGALDPPRATPPAAIDPAAIDAAAIDAAAVDRPGAGVVSLTDRGKRRTGRPR